jgi:hypothetical protein
VDFRNAFGAAWGLRVQERFNALAQRHRWPVYLTWHGFRPLGGALGPERPDPVSADRLEALLVEALRSVLWRFVSPRWIAVRLPDSLPASSSRDTPPGEPPRN